MREFSDPARLGRFGFQEGRDMSFNAMVARVCGLPQVFSFPRFFAQANFLCLSSSWAQRRHDHPKQKSTLEREVVLEGTVPGRIPSREAPCHPLIGLYRRKLDAYHLAFRLVSTLSSTRNSSRSSDSNLSCAHLVRYHLHRTPVKESPTDQEKKCPW